MCIEAERDLLLLTINVRGGPVVPQENSMFGTWFVVCTVRDILAREFTALSDNKKASLHRGSIFRKIRQGGSAYMDYEGMWRLMERVMTSAVESLSEDLGLLKEFAAGYMEELARNELCLDVGVFGIGYLTCTKVDREDIPWRVGLDSKG